jgi:hypothetical protein
VLGACAVDTGLMLLAMYGVPENLNLSAFVNTELSQIDIGQAYLNFCFHPIGIIQCYGDWEATNPDGGHLDGSLGGEAAGSERDSYRVHKLLGIQVVAVQVNPPKSISWIFEGGYKITIFDSSEAYESFTIEPGGIIV